VNLRGSKFLTSLAMRTGKAEMSKRVIGPTPLRPASRFDQTSSLVLPEPQMRPMPVTTTRRFNPYLQDQKLAAFGLLRMFLYLVYCVTHALNLLRVFLGNLDSELFFKSHHQLNGIEGIGAKIINEARIGSHFALVHAEFIDNYLFNPFLNGPF